MKILISWLRDFVSVDVSAQELANALTMRAFEVSSIEPAPSRIISSDADAVLDLEITTNRPDCLSVLGIAREVSAIYGTRVHVPSHGPTSESSETRGAETTSPLSVKIEDSQLCPRYVASAINVTVGPSPSWLAARLEASGVKPVNNVVDATNYVMLELGHPTHAFDLNHLEGKELNIRRAHVGETILTLDGKERGLSPDMLVIADATQPQALAGIMGGAESEVSGSTRTVVLESAYFLPISIRRTSKQTGLSTDASYRFERGADIEAPLIAMKRLRSLLSEIAEGQPRGPIIDQYPHTIKPVTLELRHEQIGRVLGVDVEPTSIATTLSCLGFSVEAVQTDKRWKVGVPSCRIDVKREIDLIEEIGRHYGYDRLPSTFPSLVRPPVQTQPWLRRQRLLRRILTASGCTEAITYSFIERANAIPFTSESNEIIGISNPLSEKFAVLRPSLIPGLVDSVIRNRRREHRDVRLFEIGKRFRLSDGETSGLAIALTGAGTPEHWSMASRDMDLFDIKGIVERVCEAIGVTPTFELKECPQLVNGRAANIYGLVDNKKSNILGHLGQLTPELAIARGFPDSGEELYVAELDLDVLTRIAVNRDAMHTTPMSRHPSIVRDLAIVIQTNLLAGEVRDTIQAASSETLISVREFDRYEGKGVPDGYVSLAFRLTFRASDRTLTDIEIDQAMEAIVARLEQEHDAKRR